MKKIQTLLFAILFANVANSQADFTSNDLPFIGDNDTIMYMNYQVITNDLEKETGSAYSWDFSQIDFGFYPSFITVDTFRVKTHFLSPSFPEATFEQYIYDFTAGDLNLFSLSNDTLYTHRLGAVVNGLVFTPPMATIAFPIKFNSASVLKYIFKSNSNAVGERTTTFKYDGFGTLKLNKNKTFTNIMRVKKIETDTNYFTKSSITYVNYIWYKQGGQVPILRLSYAGAGNYYNAFASKAHGTNTGIIEIEKLQTTYLFPNPTTGKISFSKLGFKPDKIEVKDLVGNLVFESISVQEIDLSGLSKGIYFVLIYKNQEILSEKIVLE